MTLEEKAGVARRGLLGYEAVGAVGIPGDHGCDGPHGLRSRRGSGHLGIHNSIKAVCFRPAAGQPRHSTGSLWKQSAPRSATSAGRRASVSCSARLSIQAEPARGRNLNIIVMTYLAGEWPPRSLRRPEPER
jgi:hypothetical protein